MYVSRKLLLKYGISLALLGMAYLGGALAQTDGAAEGSTYHQDRLVSEVPSGAINGSNTTFTVSQVPQGASTDFLYRNGVRLVYQADYQVRANVISIASSQVPQVGDSLYFSYLPDASSTRSIMTTPRTAAPAENQDEVSIAACREALRNEAIDLSSGVDRASTGRRLHLFHDSGLTRQHENEALAMLASRLTNETSENAVGVEGLGDASAPSVYSTPTRSGSYGRRTSNDASFTGGPRQHRESTIANDDRDSSSALRMLESRLSNVDPQQIDVLSSSADSRNAHPDPQRGMRLSADTPALEVHRIGRTSREAMDMLVSRIGIAAQREIAR